MSKVPISNCLMVENINPTTTKDSLELYFESKRSKGSDVEKVEMVPGENKCFVYFEDHTGEISSYCCSFMGYLYDLQQIFLGIVPGCHRYIEHWIAEATVPSSDPD